MTVKLQFHIYRNRENGFSPFRSIAVCSLNGRIFTMKDLQSVVDNYSIRCDPTDIIEERPIHGSFILEFEDHMYSAFVIAEL